MRMLFECVECGSHYLPPEQMVYPDGPASPLWCTHCQAGQLAAGVQEDPLLARLALAAARSALAGRVADETPPARADVRPSRPPLSRRARSGPGGVRGKLA
ncbi:hypothetical protein [Kitasatospora sp. NPDC056181]|uniref:hypothetical protein n=1 Tax=Kitasatospora sp. NPDC056181 TaxID=3345737 RepID=UPI0035DF5701